MLFQFPREGEQKEHLIVFYLAHDFFDMTTDFWINFLGNTSVYTFFTETARLLLIKYGIYARCPNFNYEYNFCICGIFLELLM